MDYTIDILDKIEELGYDINDVTPEQAMSMKMAIREFAFAGFSECKRLAQERLKSTSKDYQRALDITTNGSDNYTITLADSAEHLENGYKPFDMKPGLLHGPKPAKISASGVMYKVIPIKAS